MSIQVEQVWKQYQVSIKAFLHKNVSNRSDVDDLLQEILIKTYQNLPTVQDNAKVKSWLFQVANNTIIDFYRRNGKPELSAESLWYDVEESSVVEQLARCVEPFIKALPSEDAQLLTAIEINGVSQKEYAKQQNINYSTLKSRLKKSRSKLKNLFDDCCKMTIDSQGNLMEFEAHNKVCKSC